MNYDEYMASTMAMVVRSISNIGKSNYPADMDMDRVNPPAEDNEPDPDVLREGWEEVNV